MSSTVSSRVMLPVIARALALVSCDIGELCAHGLAWTLADLSGRPAPGADEVAAALALRNGAPLSGSLAPKSRLGSRAEVEQAVS